MAPAVEARGGGEAVEGGKLSRRKGRRYLAYLRRPSCFKRAGDPPAVVDGGDRKADKGGDEEGKRRMPTHLVVMVNGIIGRSGIRGRIDPFLVRFFSFFLVLNITLLTLFVRGFGSNCFSSFAGFS